MLKYSKSGARAIEARKGQKMTKKEMLEKITNGEINEEVIAKAKEMLEKLEVANAKKAAKDWEKRNEKNSALIGTIMETLEKYGEASTISLSEIAGVSKQKISGVCRSLVAEGRLESFRALENSKAVTAYRLTREAETEE